MPTRRSRNRRGRHEEAQRNRAPARVETSCDESYIFGSVLDVEMTMLDKQSKGIPIDEQANDNVVHLDRFREADRLADQAFDPCA